MMDNCFFRITWSEYFNQNGIEHIFYSADLALSTDNVDTNLENLVSIDKNGKDKIIEHSQILSRDELIEVFEEYHAKYFPQENVLMIGLVGYPNVGKSSTINSLFLSKKVAVAATPGKTKHFQVSLKWISKMQLVFLYRHYF